MHQPRAAAALVRARLRRSAPGRALRVPGQRVGVDEHREPPHRLDATWEYGGQTSWVELRLSAEPGGGTRLALEHIAHVDDELWSQLGSGAVGVGWDQGVVALALHLAGTPDRAAAGRTTEFYGA